MTRFAGIVSSNGKTSKHRVRLDWRAYFYKFVEAHGEPVVYNEGMLLFRDGWRYEIGDYQGPEHEPPVDEDKLQDLRRHYWEILKAKLQGEHADLKRQISMLVEWDMHRDQPLQQRVVYESRNEAGVITLMSDAEDFDAGPLLSKLNGLEYLLKECEDNLVSLGGAVKGE